MHIDRRTFLAAGAGLGLRAAQAAGKWNMRLATSTVMFNSLPVEEACARIAEAGYAAVDFWQGQTFRVQHLEEAAARLGPAGLRNLLVRHKLKLCAFTCYLGIPVEPYASMLGKAGDGQGLLIRESRYLKSPAGTPAASTEDVHAQMRTLVQDLKPYLSLADKHGFRIAIENHGGAILNSLESFQAYVEVATHPRLGIALAPYHLQRDNIPVEKVVAVAGKRIWFFYAWQNEPEIRQLPGFGATDFTPWTRALARAGYAGYMNPFMHENLRATGAERHGMAPAEMVSALVKSRLYLEQCRARI